MFRCRPPFPLPSRSAFVTAFLLVLTVSVPARGEAVCSLDGVSLPDGRQQMFYSARSVPRGQSCAAVGQPRQCNGGVLTGAEQFRYGRCTELEEFLGVNVNRKPGNLDPDLLARTGTVWIRANVEILEYKRQDESGKRNPDWDFGDWQTYIAAAAGTERKAILNQMWNFRAHNLRPPKPRSQRERALFDYLDRKILDLLAPNVDILVTGNEPFINTRPEDWQYDPAYGGAPIVVFYKRVTEHVQAYLEEKGLREQVDLYLGAFTGLHLDRMQKQPAVRELLAWAEVASFVDGVDMHTHVVSVRQIEKALTFVRSFTSKPVTVTEFTFVWRMKQAVERGDRLGAAFATRWGRDPNRTIGDYMACEVFGVARGCEGKGPVSKAEWDDFFATRDWYIDHFILKAEEVFRKYGVRGSTFGLVQTRPTRAQMAPDRAPWYMGFLFVPVAVAPGPDGRPQPNYQYLDDFLAVQRARTGASVH